MLAIRRLLFTLLAFTILPVSADGNFRLGTNVWPGYEPFYLAQSIENRKAGSEIQLVEYSSATDVIRAFRNKAIEAAALTLDEVLLLRESELPVSVILVTDVSHGGDVIMAAPSIKSFAEIKGKRVGVEAAALGAYVLTRALEINKLNLDDIQIVSLDVSAHEKAFKNNQVDAVVTFEPVRTKLMALGANEIFTSREIPGEVVDVVVVHNDVLKRDPEKVRTLIKGWFKALTYLTEFPEEASVKIAERLKITPKEALESFHGLKLPSKEENQKMLGGAEPTLNAVLTKLQNTMLEQELLLDPVNINQLLTPEFLLQSKHSGK